MALFFSHSGNTEECVKAATHLNQRGVTTLCIVGNKGETVHLMEGKRNILLFRIYCVAENICEFSY